MFDKHVCHVHDVIHTEPNDDDTSDTLRNPKGETQHLDDAQHASDNKDYAKDAVKADDKVLRGD